MNMIANTATAAVSRVQGALTTQTEQWGTTLGQCEGVEKKDWLWSVFCTWCASAYSKGQQDKTHPVFNFFCFTPLGAYSYVRNSYGIMGECGEDCFNGGLCMPCGTRQVYTEAKMRGPIAGHFGETTGQWAKPLAQCECMEFMKAAFCPCIVAHEIRQMIQPKAHNCFDYFCLIPMSMYGQTRVTYGIGSGWPHPACEDVLLGFFLYPCALNRALNEAVHQKQIAATAPVTGVLHSAQAQLQQVGSNALGKLSNFGRKVTGGGATKGGPPAPGQQMN